MTKCSRCRDREATPGQYYCKQCKAESNHELYVQRKESTGPRAFVAINFEHLIDERELWKIKDDNPEAIFVGFGFMRGPLYQWLIRTYSEQIIIKLDALRTLSRVSDTGRLTLNNGTTFHLYEYKKDDTAEVRAGKVAFYRNTVKGQKVNPKDRITVIDVQGFLGEDWDSVTKRYGTTDLTEIMERTRSSLERVGLRVGGSLAWFRYASVVDAAHVPIVPYHGPIINLSGRGPLIGHNYFGHVEQPVFEYDLNSAYLAELYNLQLPNGTQPFQEVALKLWNARQALTATGDPAAFVVKLASTTIVGQFAREKGKRYNPILAIQVYQAVRSKLELAMKTVEGAGGNIIRWHTDGFFADIDVSSQLDVGPNLGQWKVKKQPFITIVSANVFWSGEKQAHGALPDGAVTQQQTLEHFATTNLGTPLPVQYDRYDLNDFEWCTEKLGLRVGWHDRRSCEACLNGSTTAMGNLHKASTREELFGFLVAE